MLKVFQGRLSSPNDIIMIVRMHIVSAGTSRLNGGRHYRHRTIYRLITVHIWSYRNR